MCVHIYVCIQRERKREGETKEERKGEQLDKSNEAKY